jgi:hypothetical protein
VQLTFDQVVVTTFYVGGTSAVVADSAARTHSREGFVQHTMNCRDLNEVVSKVFDDAVKALCFGVYNVLLSKVRKQASSEWMFVRTALYSLTMEEVGHPVIIYGRPVKVEVEGGDGDGGRGGITCRGLHVLFNSSFAATRTFEARDGDVVLPRRKAEFGEGDETYNPREVDVKFSEGANWYRNVRRDELEADVKKPAKVQFKEEVGDDDSAPTPSTVQWKKVKNRV